MKALGVRRDSLGIVCANPETFAAEWSIAFGSGRAFFGVDKRSTSSSRKPGKAIEGIVDHTRGSKLAACPKCGGLRHNLGGSHAPVQHADGSLTDCRGDVVVAARAAAAA